MYPARIASDSQRSFSSLAALLLLNVGQGYAVVVAPNQQQKSLADFSPPILARYTERFVGTKKPGLESPGWWWLKATLEEELGANLEGARVTGNFVQLAEVVPYEVLAAA